jgi:hypothetical protein
MGSADGEGVLMAELIALRQLAGAEPAIVVPYPAQAWLKFKRIEKCEIYSLPEKPLVNEEERMLWALLLEPAWWIQLFKRDVTFWPIDMWSAVVFNTVVREMMATELHCKIFSACRWAWCNDDDPEDVRDVQTLWRLDMDGNVNWGGKPPVKKAAE